MWNAGKPDVPPHDSQEATESGRGIQKHATYSGPFESFITNTGDLLIECKGGWKVGKGDPNETPMSQEESERAW